MDTERKRISLLIPIRFSYSCVLYELHYKISCIYISFFFGICYNDDYSETIFGIDNNDLLDYLIVIAVVMFFITECSFFRIHYNCQAVFFFNTVCMLLYLGDRDLPS